MIVMPTRISIATAPPTPAPFVEPPHGDHFVAESATSVTLRQYPYDEEEPLYRRNPYNLSSPLADCVQQLVAPQVFTPTEFSSAASPSPNDQHAIANAGGFRPDAVGEEEPQVAAPPLPPEEFASAASPSPNDQHVIADADSYHSDAAHEEERQVSRLRQLRQEVTVDGARDFPKDGKSPSSSPDII